ncbi:pentapeptide repeat-containing protein [Sphaerisporangium sp. B11E5]|uniref:pentapeptide repeat-containing protein n=1 Tax=Sphaerisporangium sp. B11E5 TaxID=3153563 RepID=UPI00325C8EFE
MGEVRATIWRLITTHLHKGAAVSWHGADLDFTGIPITTDLDFTNTLFPSGTVRFDQANFSAGTVNFREAKFSGGEVHFIGAKFSGSTVDFHGAKFSGGTVDFKEVHDWSHPAIGLPERAPGLRLPPPVAGEPTSRHE